MKTNAVPIGLAAHVQPLALTNRSATKSLLVASVAILALASLPVFGQCPAVELISGLNRPLGIAQSNQRNLLVSEAGTIAPNTGRISIVDLSGHRRTLLDGLPSAINAVNERSGPYGLVLRGRTLYLVIGEGNVAVPGPIPGSALPNPNPPSSPIFSSLLAVHFSASVENNTEGFALASAHHEALADGEKIILSNGHGDNVMIELIADLLPNFTPNPLPTVPANVRLSNPFDVVVVADQAYVTDASQNSVWQVDIPTGAFATLAAFPTIPNPLFNPAPPPPSVGGPLLEAVPTGIRYFDGLLLVGLFRGSPFPPGTSQVQAVDPLTGNHAPFITGLKTAIDVLPVSSGGETGYLVLQHASAGPFFGSPGLLLHFAASGGAPTVIANCLARPTSMVLDEKSRIAYVTEYAGRVVAVPLEP
jgi:hypothetical protein